MNPKLNRNKYKELHVGRNINGTNEREEPGGDYSCSESDWEVTFYNKLYVN